MRTLLVTLVFAFAGLLAVDLAPSATPRPAEMIPGTRTSAAAPTVAVFFVRNGRLVRVTRVVPRHVARETYALRELVLGPTRAERLEGLRTALGKNVRLRSLRPDEEVWRANFSRSLFGPGTAETVETRLAQVEATLAPLGTEQYVAVAAEGRLVTTLRLGMRPPPLRSEVGEKGYPYSIRGIQLRLWTLGYLDHSAVSGVLDYATEQALLAFQGWEGTYRSGTVTGETQIALLRASRPRPGRTGQGRRIEIHRDQGVLLMVDGDETVRAVHTSTGSYGRTPAGVFHVYRKELISWSVPFEVWMPYASYFTGGIAMHEYSYVPSYPASHGCVRLPAGDAQRVYAFVGIGTPVDVF